MEMTKWKNDKVILNKNISEKTGLSNIQTCLENYCYDKNVSKTNNTQFRCYDGGVIVFTWKENDDTYKLMFEPSSN